MIDILIYAAVVIVACILVINLVVLHKARWIHLKTFEILGAISDLSSKHLHDQFRQIQALLALDLDLGRIFRRYGDGRRRRISCLF